METMIKIRGLHKSFGKTQVLKNINLELQAGETIAILGESGCGKSTLLSCIAGFLEVDDGEIYVHNILASAKNVSLSPSQRGIGILFQDYAVFPHLNVYENVTFGLSNLSKSQQNARVKQLLEMLRLEGLEKRYLQELSGGQAQRVALARAIAPNPKILLLDEPFSSLNSELSAKMRRDIKEVIESYRLSVIFVTHDKEDAFHLADKICIIKDGEIIDSGDPQSLYENPRSLESAKFLGAVNYIEQYQSIKDNSFREWLISRRGIFRPKHLEITSNHNGISVEVVENKFFGDWVEVVVMFDGHFFSIHTREEKRVGEILWLKFI